jgi:hypothetical protein
MKTFLTLEPVCHERDGTAEANLASRLLLVASIIVNVINTDNFLVLASVLNLAAGLLTIKSAKLEAEQQQIAPGVTTFANGLKLIGSHTGLFVSIVFFLALLIEINLKQVEPTPAEPTFAGALGAFRI